MKISKLFVFVILLSIFFLLIIPENIAYNLPIYLRVISFSLKGNFADGFFDGKPNLLDFSHLEIGDIILVGNPRSVYGHYTHAAMYVGNGFTVDGNIGEGIRYVPINHYRYYTYGKILRVNLPKEIKLKAAYFAQKEIGKVFFLTTSFDNPYLTYCTKIIYSSYKKANVELIKPSGFLVLPDDILKSRYVTILQ